MNGWWVLANLVLTAHLALFAVLVAGVVLAAAGWLRPRIKLSAAFWLTLFVTLAWQPLPGCGLTQLERWLRCRVEPDWDRDLSLLRVVFETVTGVRAPAILDVIFPVSVAALGVYAFASYYLRDLLATVQRRMRAR